MESINEMIIGRAFVSALKRFDKNYPDTRKLTAETFARKTFVVDAMKLSDKANNLVLSGECTEQDIFTSLENEAYFRMLIEHQAFNSYARPEGTTREEQLSQVRYSYGQ